MTLKMIIFYAIFVIGFLYYIYTPDSDRVFPIWHFICSFGWINFYVTTAMALNGQYNTPLTCAIFNGNVEIVKILLLHDAQENYPATSLITPFFVASVYGRSEISNILLEKSPRLIDQEPIVNVAHQWQQQFYVVINPLDGDARIQEAYLNFISFGVWLHFLMFIFIFYGRSEISNILLEKSPRLIDQEPSKCCEYRWCCTPMAAAVLCCNKPVRWRRQDTRSIFKFYFVWGVLAFFYVCLHFASVGG